jgi:hypothetical protein
MATWDTSPSALQPQQGRDRSPERQGESRSFAGSRRVKVDPITTAKPTNADLAHGFNQLHICHEDTKATVEKIAGALGLDGNGGPGKPVAGLSTPRKAFIRTVLAVTTSIIVLAGVYRFLVAISPAFWALLKAVNTAILTGKI